MRPSLFSPSFFLPALLAVSFLLCGPAFAGSSKQDEFLKRLENESGKIESISSSFTQESFISLFQDRIESEGRFTFARPDNLRWEYSAPFVSGFLLKGQQGLRWDEAATASRPFSTETAPEMGIISEQILAWTTMDIGWLKSRYALKMTAYTPAVMELIPNSKTAGSFISRIKIFFSPDATHLQAIELHEPDGDYTRVTFQDVEINGPLPKDIFERR